MRCIRESGRRFRCRILGVCAGLLLSSLGAGGFGLSVCAAGPLRGKTALFAGDSIAAGWRDKAMNGSDYGTGNGWSRRIGDANGMTVTNIAVPGATLSTIRDKRIITQIKSKKSTGYEYVILQGGFNDAMGTDEERTKESAAPIGTMSSSYELDSFDIGTYAGALEELFYWSTTYFEGSRIGYIVTYATPLSQYGGYTADMAYMSRQYAVGKAICAKWGIACLDLFSGTAADGRSYSSDILEVDTPRHFPVGSDCIHLNSAGYDVISPYIAEWMETIQPHHTGTAAASTTTVKQTAAPAKTTTAARTTAAVKTTARAKTAAPVKTTTVQSAAVTTVTTAARPSTAATKDAVTALTSRRIGTAHTAYMSGTGRRTSAENTQGGQTGRIGWWWIAALVGVGVLGAVAAVIVWRVRRRR